jgi:hypothetical protein
VVAGDEWGRRLIADVPIIFEISRFALSFAYELGRDTRKRRVTRAVETQVLLPSIRFWQVRMDSVFPIAAPIKFRRSRPAYSRQRSDTEQLRRVSLARTPLLAAFAAAGQPKPTRAAVWRMLVVSHSCLSSKENQAMQRTSHHPRLSWYLLCSMPLIAGVLKNDPDGFGRAVYRSAACPPGSLCILFLDDCPPRNLRELDYLVIHEAAHDTLGISSGAACGLTIRGSMYFRVVAGSEWSRSLCAEPPAAS